MPWVIKKNDKGQECIYKEGADGQAEGEALGCHTSHEDAVSQMRALYANEPGAKAVKFVDGEQTALEGLLCPIGGPFNGSDIQGERFTAKTDFCLDWFAERPLLYHHGLDPEVGTAVVGRIKSVETQPDLGLWMKAQLDKNSKYYDAIRKLVEQGALQLSSGAMGHLAKVSKSGDILRWPLVEGTLTPTPANPLATVDFATAKAHFKAIDVEVPESLAPRPVEVKTVAGSYESLLERLSAALNPSNPFVAPDRYAYVGATYADHCKAYLYEHGEGNWYDVAYTQDALGTVKLGEVTPTDEAPLADVQAPENLAAHTELVTAYAAALAQRTKDLSERRTKEGRILSSATRKRLGDCLQTMGAAATALQALLDSTDPAKAEAKASLERLRDEFDLFRYHATLDSLRNLAS